MGGHKGVIFCIKTCFRSVCRHPFLTGMVFSMIFLYKYLPFMFSLLVSASPVFLTTAALLATMLSYGKPNVPVVHKQGKLSTGNVFSRIGVQRDGSFFKRNDNFDSVERFLEIRRGVVKRSIGEASSSAINFSGAGRDDTLSHNNAVLGKEKSREFQIDKQESDVERKTPDTVVQKNDKMTDLKEGKSESLGIQESHEKSLDQTQDKSPKEVDGIFPTGSHWKQEDEGEEDDDRDISDSGSDRTVSERTESVSPGTSITDISPIDELHPLLDEDAPQPTLMSTEISDATSEVSSNTISESSYDLDTDMETHGEELEVTDLEEEIYADNDDDVKSAVSWTDDDHKNVINLGSSDLERNQCLENLIATRSLRKSMNVMAERNLIDLDGIDRPPNVAHISTARRNPFDLNSNLPGSAPSIMAPRRSPFELPYDPGEEKHDLMGDDYEHFVTLQPKDTPVLRRNETFSAGTSLLGTSRHDYNLRPNYVLQRKLSDVSESKTSSEPETESLGSVEELEDKIPVEEDDSREPVVTTIAEHPSEDVGHGSESKTSSEHETESLGSVEELEDKIPVEEDDSQEPVVTTIAEHPSEDVGHGSESSEDEDTFESTEAEKKYVTPDDIRVNLGDVDSSQEKVLSLSETAVADTHMEGDTSEANEVVTPDDNSSTSLSEEHENVFNGKEGEQLSHFKPAIEISDAESTSQSVDDTHHKEPVYDSSPTACLSSSSICSDHQVDIVETNSPPVSVECTVSATDSESDVSNQITEKDTPATETDEKLISAHHQSPSENTTLIQSDKELPASDQSIVEHSPVKHEELQDSAKCVNASEVQELVEETQQNGKPTTSEAASTQSEILETEATPDRTDSEGNMPCVGNSDAILISEKPLLEKTGSGPAESEEVPSRNTGETISDVPVESGTVKDKEPQLKEDEHTGDGSGGSEISTREDNIPHTVSGPADSEEVPSQNAGETISGVPVESGTVKDKEPRVKEDEHRDDGSGGSEISPREDNIPHTVSGPADSEEVPSRNAGETISGVPVESGTVKDKEPRVKEDEHRDDGSGGSEISPREDNIPHTVSGPADSEEVPSRNAGETISGVHVESGTVKDKEPRVKEDEHTDGGSGGSEISPGEDNIHHVGTSGTILISEKPLLEKTGSGPADSEEVPSRNAGETISDVPVESGTVKDKQPQLKEDEHTDDGSGGSEISPREEVPSRNAGETISDMPVESGTVKDKEPRYEEDEHRDDGSNESELSPKSKTSLEAEVGLPVAEAQSFDNVKSASEQVHGVELQKPPDLSLNETKDGYSEHVSDEIGSESSSSVQDGHSEQHHEEALDKENLPDSKNDEPKKSPQPKSWWSRFRRT